MIHDLWMVAGFGPVLGIGTAFAFAHRRRRGVGPDMEYGGSPPPLLGGGSHLPPDVGAAEQELGILLRRMRAFTRAPYDFAASRISDDSEFERCLDLATVLSLRVSELSGALDPSSSERERVRDQLLSSVSERVFARRN